MTQGAQMAVTIAVAIISSSAFSALITGLFARRQDKQRKESGVSSGVRMLLYDRIKFLGKKYIASGVIEADALEDLIEMHKIYHDELAGNGFLDKIMADVKALPVTRREKK